MKLHCEGQVRSGADDAASEGTTAPAPWRRAFRRHLTLWLLVKLVALSVLWALCFSPAHRSVVDSRAVERRLVPARLQPAAGPAAPRLSAAQDVAHD